MRRSTAALEGAFGACCVLLTVLGLLVRARAQEARGRAQTCIHMLVLVAVGISHSCPRMCEDASRLRAACSGNSFVAPAFTSHVVGFWPAQEGCDWRSRIRFGALCRRDRRWSNCASGGGRQVCRAREGLPLLAIVRGVQVARVGVRDSIARKVRFAAKWLVRARRIVPRSTLWCCAPFALSSVRRPLSLQPQVEGSRGR